MKDEAVRLMEYMDQHEEDLVALLKNLIGFPSVTGEEKAIQDFIASRLTDMGLEVDVWEPDQEELKKHPNYVHVPQGYKDRPNVVGVYKGKGGGRSLLFNGHVDVIPTGPLESWAHDPWAAFVKNGRVYGRGSSDMKAGLAAMTFALEIVLNTGRRPRGDVILEYTVDEELTGNGTLACILKGYRADAGISCETSSLCVQPAAIGRMWFEIMVKGKPTGFHRGREGINAITKAYKIIEAVSDYQETRINELKHPLYPITHEAIPCMVTMIQGGSFPSAFPDTCLLKGSIATLPGEDSNEVKEKFREQISLASRGDPWMKEHPPEVRFNGLLAEPSEMSADHSIIKALANNFRNVTNHDPTISGRTGAADTRFLNTYGSTPTVIFGPGLATQIHAMNEYVEIDDVKVAAKVLALTILDWCH